MTSSRGEWIPHGAAGWDRLEVLDNFQSQYWYTILYRIQSYPIIGSWFAHHFDQLTSLHFQISAPGRFGQSHFKVGKDDHGQTVRLRADYFEQYTRTTLGAGAIYNHSSSHNIPYINGDMYSIYFYIKLGV